jgi:hypothetical protein
MDENLEKKIIKLWKSPTYNAAFTGLTTFRDSLEDQGIKVSLPILRSILSKIPEFFISLTPPRNLRRRKYCVYSSNSLGQFDIAQMSTYKLCRSFLLYVNVFTYKLHAIILKSKTTQSVHTALEKIFNMDGYPDMVESDAANEFKVQIAFTFALH